MGLKLITPATTYPVTLAEAKAHLNVDDSEYDALIDLYIAAATDDAENFTGRAFYDQVWDYYLDAFPDDDTPIGLPRSPLIEVSGLFYRDSAGVEQTFGASGYGVDLATDPGRVSLVYGGAWPSAQDVANAVRIRFRSGYVDQDVSPESGNVPAAIKAAILLTVGTLYMQRETVVIGQTAAMIPWSAEQLLRPYRVHTAIG